MLKRKPARVFFFLPNYVNMYYSFPFFFLAAGSSCTWEGMFYSGEQNRQGPETLVNSKLILTWPFSSLWIFKMVKCASFPFLLNSPVIYWDDGVGVRRFNIQIGKLELKKSWVWIQRIEVLCFCPLFILSTYPFIHWSIHLSIRPSIHVFVHLSVRPSICPSVHPLICIFLCNG